MTKYLKDILDQPEQLQQSLQYSITSGKQPLQAAASLIKKTKHVFISAIGASWSAGLAIQAAFNQSGVQAILCDAADFFHYTKIPADSVVLFLSRSGKSVELVNALPRCRAADAGIISITNAADSPLGKEADICLLTNVAFDHSISVSTYTSIILTGILLAEIIEKGEIPGSTQTALKLCFDALPQSIQQWQQQVASSDWLLNISPYVYFLARGINIASAHEGMLLWEEAAKQPAAALTTGTFRHGPQEIIKNPLSIAVWISNDAVKKHDIALVKDLVSKGVRILMVGNDLPEDTGAEKIYLPAIPGLFGPVINIIPIQLAVEKLAHLKQVDPDNFYFCSFVVEKEGGL
ncbi:MAG: SIS domain-containing protein [Chitinophagaceae bacterium]|nr:SIS domain-containing protein [Chitinophagaceae bacterium]MCW5928410.1 SIS domain-containing protein [Chitinophagaceae bacterium]